MKTNKSITAIKIHKKTENGWRYFSFQFRNK